MKLITNVHETYLAIILRVNSSSLVCDILDLDTGATYTKLLDFSQVVNDDYYGLDNAFIRVVKYKEYMIMQCLDYQIDRIQIEEEDWLANEYFDDNGLGAGIPYSCVGNYINTMITEGRGECLSLEGDILSIHTPSFIYKYKLKDISKFIKVVFMS